MKAYLHARAGMKHQSDAMSALQEGLFRHGIHVADSIDECDFSVWWGEPTSITAKAKPFLVLEAGYINGRSGDYVRDRLRFISSGWGGLHHRANPDPSDRPPNRWRQLGVELQPWRDPGPFPRVLLLKQVDGDKCAPGPDTWRAIERRAGWRYGQVTVRNHPFVDPDVPPLAEQLATHDMAITWCSTAAIESVVAGIPTVTLNETSMAWPVTSHRMDDMPCMADRLQWAYNLAYRQWTHAELRDGTAWEFLEYGIADGGRTGNKPGHVGGSENAFANHA